MTAYLIADIDIHDDKGYEDYRRRVPAIIASYGGRYLVRGSTAEVLEGELQARARHRHRVSEHGRREALLGVAGVPAAACDSPNVRAHQSHRVRRRRRAEPVARDHRGAFEGRGQCDCRRAPEAGRRAAQRSLAFDTLSSRDFRSSNATTRSASRCARPGADGRCRLR